MTRTTDEIKAMTMPELRAAVAVDLLGWEMEEGVPFDGAVRANYNDIDVLRRPESLGHPGGWLGIVDDAMIARGYQLRCNYFGGIWTARYAYECGSSNPDRETATLRAVLLALAADAAAKGGA